MPLRRLLVLVTLLLLARPAQAAPVLVLGGGNGMFVVVGGGPPVTQVIEVINVSNANVRISQVVLDAGPMGGGNPGDFALDRSKLPDGTVLPPMSKVLLTITVKPSAQGVRTARLVILTDDPNQPVLYLPLTATVIVPSLVVKPAFADFGAVGVLAKATKTFTVENAGANPVSLEDFRYVDPMQCGCMQVNNAPKPGMWPVLLPKQSLNFDVVCSPQSEGAFSTRIEIDSDDPAARHIQVPLSCQGVVAGFKVTPPAIDFGRILAGTASSPQLVHITSTATVEWTWDAPLLIAGNPNIFAFDQVGKFTLAAGQSKDIAVTCSPPSVGAFMAALALGTVRVSLTCTGARLAVEVSTGQSPPDTADFDKLRSPMVPVGMQSDALRVQIRVPPDGLPVQLGVIRSDHPAFVVDAAALQTRLAPGDTTTFLLMFRPTATGRVTGDVSIALENATRPAATVHASGTGVTIVEPAVSSEASCSTGGRGARAGASVLFSFVAAMAVLRMRQRGRKGLARRDAP